MHRYTRHLGSGGHRWTYPGVTRQGAFPDQACLHNKGLLKQVVFQDGCSALLGSQSLHGLSCKVLLACARADQLWTWATMSSQGDAAPNVQENACCSGPSGVRG